MRMKNFKISATYTKVPVVGGHSEIDEIEFEDELGNNEIKRIARFLGISKSDKEMACIAENLWGGKTRTMKYGKSSYWKNKFSSKLEKIFWQQYGGYMKKLGYPREP